MSTVARKSYVRGFLLVVLGFVLAVLLGLLLGRFVDSRPTASANGNIAGTGVGTGVGTSGVDGAGSSSSFTISGNTAKSISPGVMAPLDLTFTNPNDVPVAVTDLRVTVREVSAPNADDAHPCTVGDFTVDQASSDLGITLAAHSTSTLSSLSLPRATLPHVGMLNRPTNQDGCKEASLALAYTATGTLEQ